MATDGRDVEKQNKGDSEQLIASSGDDVTMEVMDSQQSFIGTPTGLVQRSTKLPAEEGVDLGATQEKGADQSASKQEGEGEKEEHMGALVEDAYSMCQVPFSGVVAWFVVGVFLVQVFCFTIALTDMLSIDPGAPPFGLPVGVVLEVRFGQCAALLFTFLSQDDLITATVDLANGHLPLIPTLMRFTCGFLGMFTSVIIVCQSSDILGLFANFAALTFISSLDNLSFIFAKAGFIGPTLKKQAELTSEFQYVETPRPILKQSLMVFIWATASSMWIASVVLAGKGLHCWTIVVQHDLYHRKLTGIYKWERNTWRNGRAVYKQEPTIGLDPATLSYCADGEGYWAFTNQSYDPCEFLVKSQKTATYDVTELGGGWFNSAEGLEPYPTRDFSLHCTDCKRNEDCSDHGSCDKSAKECNCKEGHSGLMCEYNLPCPEFAVDGWPDYSDRYYRLDINRVPVVLNARAVFGYRYPGAEPQYDLVWYDGGRWVVSYGTYPDAPTFAAFANRLTFQKHLFGPEDTMVTGLWIVSDFSTVYDPTSIKQWYLLDYSSLCSGLPCSQEPIDATISCLSCEVTPCGEGACLPHSGSGFKQCVCRYGWSGPTCALPPATFRQRLVWYDNGVCRECLGTDWKLRMDEAGHAKSEGERQPYSCWTLFEPFSFALDNASHRFAMGVNGTHFNIYRSQDNRTFQTWESEEPLYLYGGDGEINHVCENANLLTSFPRDANSHTRIKFGISMTNSSWKFSDDPPCTAISKDQCVGTYGWSKGKIESAWLYIDLKLQAQISVV
eukprot:g65760.t1